MKTILSFSQLLLVPTILLVTTSCDLPSNEQIVDPNAEAEYRKPAIPIEEEILPYTAPEQSPALAKNPDIVSDLLDKGIDEIVVNRGPEILDSILGNSEDAELIRSALEQAPAMIEEIMNLTKDGTQIPPEVIYEAREIVAQNGPAMIDQMINETGADDHPIARVFGEFILQKILDSLDKEAAQH